MTFAGALSGPQARGLLAFAGVPWNKVPANLAGARLGATDEGLRIPEPRADTCAPAGARGSGPNARGVVQNFNADMTAFVVRYRDPSVTREGGGRDFRVLGFEKDYAPLLSRGAPVLYVWTTDTRCNEEVLFTPQAAVLGGLVTQAEVDRAAASMFKTPEQLAIISTRLAAQPALTAAAHERARRDGTIFECIARALGLPGTAAEWRCPTGLWQWLMAFYGTPLGKVAAWGTVVLVGIAVVPPLVRLARPGR